MLLVSERTSRLPACFYNVDLLLQPCALILLMVVHRAVSMQGYHVCQLEVGKIIVREISVKILHLLMFL